MNSNVKTAVFWIVILCAVVLVWMAVDRARSNAQEPGCLRVRHLVQEDKVKEANITGTEVQGTLVTTAPSYHTQIPPNYTGHLEDPPG